MERFNTSKLLVWKTYKQFPVLSKYEALMSETERIEEEKKAKAERLELSGLRKEERERIKINRIIKKEAKEIERKNRKLIKKAEGTIEERQEAYMMFQKNFQKELEKSNNIGMKVKRKIIRTPHSIQRFNERLSPFRYSLGQMKTDLRLCWRKVCLVWNAYEVKWAIATYIIKKDDEKFRRVVITIYLSHSQEKIANKNLTI